MIFNFSGGGGTGLNVVTGLSTPANPKDNTVWVKSDKARKKYVIAKTAPEDAAEGLIWLVASNAGILTAVQVFTGTTWEFVDAFMYLQGEWFQFSWPRYYLIKDGAKIVPITVHSNAKMTVTPYGYVTISTNGNIAAFAYHQADVTKYNKLCLELCAPQNGEPVNRSWRATGIPAIGASSVQPAFSGETVQTLQALTYLNSATGNIAAGLYTVDVSEMAGDKYLTVTVAGSAAISGETGYLHIKNLYLEAT